MSTPESLRLTILNCVMRSLPDATQVLHQKAHLKPDPKTSIPQLCPFHLHSRTFKIVLSLNKRSNKLSFVLATGCFDGTCREPAFDKGNGAHQVECIPGGHVPGPTWKDRAGMSGRQPAVAAAETRFRRGSMPSPSSLKQLAEGR